MDDFQNSQIPQPPVVLQNRRVNDPLSPVIELVKQIHANQIALDAKLSKGLGDQTIELATAIATLMKDSFPEGDPDGHRRYHEASIKAAEERAKFWAELKGSVVKWGVVGVLTFIAGAAWKAFLLGPKP
jgi:hypothetical protein